MLEVEYRKKQDISKLKYLREKIRYGEQIIYFADVESSFVVGIVDIVGSTLVSSKLNNTEVAKYYGIFLNSMARIIREHEGVIIKNIGDSLLYYFKTNVVDKNDILQPLECCMTMTECEGIINDIMWDEGLPRIQYRVSADYGKVMVAKTSTMTEIDVFGSTVNYCSKINSIAKPNGFVIGHDMRILIGKTDKFSFTENTYFASSLKQRYPIYHVGRSPC
jgi:class 3 adenylate cyclase